MFVVAAVLAIASQVAQLRAVASSGPPPAPQAQPAPAPQARPGPRMLDVDRELLHGDYVWDERGAPPGRISILVDISAQTLSVFRGDREIGRAIILYGTDEQPTPLGTFRITEKDADHESNLYEAQMPYMLRLTNDGIAIHGSIVEYGKASRGCVGVPDEFAALLFEQARLGDVVTIVAGGPPPARALNGSLI